jgi:hypothetical protein
MSARALRPVSPSRSLLKAAQSASPSGAARASPTEGMLAARSANTLDKTVRFRRIDPAVDHPDFAAILSPDRGPNMSA